jgi:hypothetical protein
VNNISKRTDIPDIMDRMIMGSEFDREVAMTLQGSHCMNHAMHDLPLG